MAENEDTELPDLRVVVITFDQDEDQLRIDTGEDVGDFEALGFLCVAFARQLAQCIGATLNYGSEDLEDEE